MGFRDLFNQAQQPADESPADESSIAVADALGLLAAGGIVIDVRNASEYEAGHIPGARLVAITDLRADPMTTIWGADPLAMMDPATLEKAVVVVSSTTAHASAVTHLLRDAGLNARSLAGGLLGWVRDGQVLVPGPPR